MRPLWSRVAVEQEEEKEEDEEDQATDIKSNNPHLAGGEQENEFPPLFPTKNLQKKTRE